MKFSTPRWSPDGQWLAAVGLVKNYWELFIMRPDGTDLRRLTHVQGSQNIWPVWSPVVELTWHDHYLVVGFGIVLGMNFWEISRRYGAR
jgi:hypothetical protein